MILDEGGVRVEVEDTSKPEDVVEADVEERLDGGMGAWKVPSQDVALGTPGGRIRIAPTAMPPMA